MLQSRAVVTGTRDAASRGMMLLDDLSQLDSVVRELRLRPDLRIVVEGTADENIALARRRANATRAHLILRGISSDRIVLSILDNRRVRLYASSLPARAISSALLDKRAVDTSWTVVHR